MKAIVFHGSSLEDVKNFPDDVKRASGDQLRFVQMGLEPADWKPIRNVGQGVMEIRIKEASGQFRIIYVVKFADAVHVLHAFQKKTQTTSGKDLDLAKKRYKEIGG
ncbi:MAG: type II toxin-antitoxin system RelE/ParE family toxin [Thermodesulfobacteriota bacterium]